MRYALLIIAGLFAGTRLFGQEYRFRQYRVEQGLPSDVIKAVSQDTLGFLWIATDDGLVKYDGLRFTTYKSAMHSQYTKGFLNTRDGRLLAIGDLDLIEIQNQVDTVVFKSLLRGTRNPTDSTLWYPKSIYEDRDGNIWLGEPQSALCFKEGKPIERFDFGVANRSPVFIRSYAFFEDNLDNLYCVSYQGVIFRFDKSAKRFTPLKTVLPDRIGHVVFKYNRLWVGAGEGVYEVNLQGGEVKEIKRSLTGLAASHVMVMDSTLWVGTFGEDFFKLSLKGKPKPEVLDYSFKAINHFYNSKEGDWWVSTDKGLVLVQRNRFVLADANSQAHFIEGLAIDPRRNFLYYCHKETLVELQPARGGTWRSRAIYENPDSYFQSLQFGEKGLWASSAFNVLLFQDGKLKRTWDFTSEGNFVHDIYLDSRQNLWLSQARNSTVMVITDSLEVKRIEIPLIKQSEINLVREGPRGMYAAASGMESYLFLKAHDSKSFKNISLPVNFKIQGDFNIHDLTIQNDVVWLGTTEGLLRYDHRTIERVQLGPQFTNFSVSSVEVLDDHNILFSNSYGLFRYDTGSGDYWLYDENAGLPSNTITNHGIFVDHFRRLWVGTSYGLALSQESIVKSSPTATPFCIEASVNGTPQRFDDGIEAPYGSFINLHFSSITFPENRIIMQWRMKGTDTTWHTMTNNQINLSEITSGQHEVEVRAKKNTGEGWSKSTIIQLTIGKPDWQRTEFVLIVVLLTVLIAWASYAISSHMARLRRKYLQDLVDQRTHDLQHANEELMVRNTELDRFVYSASHDLSAPLKSILGLIAVARMDKPDPGQEQYLVMMERSVRKLEEFIEEVVSYSRNTRMPIKWEPCDFRLLVQGLLLDHQYAPDFSKISFEVENLTGVEMVTDVARLKIILNNLISNAIKFHWFEGPRKPFVKISLSRSDNDYVITVQDNGRGIEVKHLTSIFDMFYRGTEKGQGSGLGLYILKESVIKLGGTVQAKSTLDEGTIFTIVLPIPKV